MQDPLQICLSSCTVRVLVVEHLHELYSTLSTSISGAQTVARGPHVARKALWSGPRGNFHW